MKPPDVKAVLLDKLPAVVGVPVLAERPDDGTTSFVRVLRTGGSGRRDRVLQTVQVTVDCYAPTEGLASDLADAVDEWMHALPASPLPINAIAGASTPADSPDPGSKSPRYTATYQLVVICR